MVVPFIARGLGRSSFTVYGHEQHEICRMIGVKILGGYQRNLALSIAWPNFAIWIQADTYRLLEKGIVLSQRRRPNNNLTAQMALPFGIVINRK